MQNEVCTYISLLWFLTTIHHDELLSKTSKAVLNESLVLPHCHSTVKECCVPLQVTNERGKITALGNNSALQTQ